MVGYHPTINSALAGCFVGLRIDPDLCICLQAVAGMSPKQEVASNDKLIVNLKVGVESSVGFIKSSFQIQINN
jgi:hypothetical protein